MAGDDDGTYEEKLRSVEANREIAQRYLDRTAHRYPPHLTLPEGLWRDTAARLSIAPPGEPRCGARAVEPSQVGIAYGPSLVLRNPISCLRPRGHDGPHAARTRAHGRHKAKWQALAWD